MQQQINKEKIHRIQATDLRICDKGITEYVELWQQMRQWARTPSLGDIGDQCWLTSHYPVFTMGQQANEGHLLANPHSIPLVHSDRGGQITYHGPGQLMFYFLLDLARRQLRVKDLVWVMEEAVIYFLAGLNIKAHRRQKMPGVYINQEKIASLGLRITKGRCYHGMSFNHQPDLGYFDCLQTCGYEDLRVTSLSHQGFEISEARIQQEILNGFCRLLCYNIVSDRSL